MKWRGKRRRRRPEVLDELGPLGIGSRVAPPPEHVGASGASDGVVEAEVESQLRDLEQRLDRIIQQRSLDELPGDKRDELGRKMQSAAREALGRLPSDRRSSRYYDRQWGREGLRSRAEEFDEMGLDPAFERRLRPLWELLYSRYFRVETEGVELVPAEGRCLIVANHSGTLPLDGPMLRTALRLAHPRPRELRWLAEDFIFYTPFLGAFMNRAGAVRACPENAERLLRRELAVGVFPEGVKGIGKLYRDRYRLQRFGRGGFIRLGLRMRSAVVPCAIVGAEEASPLLFKEERVSRALGLPYFPVTPTFPLLGALGLLPAPTKWKIRFGRPLDLSGMGPTAADDSVLVARLAERVRRSIQEMLDETVKTRRSVWFG